MEGCLVRIEQRRCLVLAFEGNARLALDRHADFLRRLELAVDDGWIGAGRVKEVPIKPAKIAVDAELLLVFLDAVDACGLAFIPELGDVLAAALDEQVEAVVALRGQVRGRAGRHALADRAAIDDDNILPGLGQFVSHRHAGDAGPHNHHISLFIAIERRRVVEDGGVHPDGSAFFAADVH